MAGGIDDYLSQLHQELRRRGVDDARTLAEAREHLIDAVEEGRGRGLSPEDAEREALERFGAAAVVAAHIVAERTDMKSVFAAVLETIWLRRWWIVVPTIAAAIVAGVTSYYFMPDRYRAETKIVVMASDTTLGLVTVTPRWANDYPELQRITRTLWNRGLLERLIQDLDLYKDEQQNVPMDVLVERVRDDIEIRIPAARVFSIGFVSDDPKAAMEVSQRLAAFLIEENVKNRSSEADRTSSFIEAQLAETRRRLIEYGATIASLKAGNGGKLSRPDELEYEFLEDRYKALLAKSEDARTAENVQRRQIGEQFRIIDVARMPEAPVGPNRLRITLLGMLVGLALGLLAIAMRRTPNASPPALAEA